MSVIGCEEEMQDLKLQLEEESAHRKQVEKELELQIQMKAESEMAAKLLEKDIHEKQDTIISLRQQLDEIKVINLEMYRKLQVRNITAFHPPPFCPSLYSHHQTFSSQNQNCIVHPSSNTFFPIACLFSSSSIPLLWIHMASSVCLFVFHSYIPIALHSSLLYFLLTHFCFFIYMFFKCEENSIRVLG